ncbi:AfsR/SARP family transcriptional regulator [Streptomyces sp. NPDC054933]
MADVGLRLLGIALHMIQDADGGEDTRVLEQVAAYVGATGVAGSSQAVQAAWAIATQRLNAGSAGPATAEYGGHDDPVGHLLSLALPSVASGSSEVSEEHRTASGHFGSPRDGDLVNARTGAFRALGADRSGHLASASDATALPPSPPFALPHPDEEGQRNPRRGAAPAPTPPSPVVAAGPINRRHGALASARLAERRPRVAIWCFGGFRMTIGDRVIDWQKVRPRARAAMRLLTVRAGQPVHREALIDALWPKAPPESATANLQVAVSSLRGLLEPDRERRKPQLVVRAGDAYLLNLPTDAYLDTLAFETALTHGQRAKAAGDTTRTVGALRDALAEYSGELLPEDGPAEWLQQDREMYRHQAANAAAEVAATELEVGKPEEAVGAAEKCLTIDPFHDTGWQLLLRAYQSIGAPAAAERARRRYTAMLASLGIDTDDPALGLTPTPSPAVRARTPRDRPQASRTH